MGTKRALNRPGSPPPSPKRTSFTSAGLKKYAAAVKKHAAAVKKHAAAVEKQAIINANAKAAAMGMMPSVKLDGKVTYTRFRLGNGTRMHFIGEHHTVDSRCWPCIEPRCITVSRLIRQMKDVSDRARQRFDVFLEVKLQPPRPSFVNYYSKRAYATSSFSPLQRAIVNHEMQRSVSPFFRLHAIDVRNVPFTKNQTSAAKANFVNTNVNHPVISALYYADGLAHLSDTRLANLMLTSNTYVDDSKKLKLPTELAKRRNFSIHQGTSVSRIRKQLLKLPPRLRNALIAAFHEVLASTPPEIRTPPGSRLASPSRAHLPISGQSRKRFALLLMDVSHLARMLYYAGHGAPSPAKAVMTVDGDAHTQNMLAMMRIIVREGALDAVEEVPHINHDKCVEVSMPLNYGF